MPSSIAARVAETASSMRCFFSLSSTSVAAPTLITQTPPASSATRSCSFSRSQSESVRAISACSCATAALTSLRIARAVDDRGVVLGHHNPTGAAQHVEADLVELETNLGSDDLAAGQDGDVLEHGLAAVTKGRSLDSRPT